MARTVQAARREIEDKYARHRGISGFGGASRKGEPIRVYLVRNDKKLEAAIRKLAAPFTVEFEVIGEIRAEKK